MRVVVDTGKCIAAGQCVAQAPNVFDQNEETGLVVLLNEHPDESDRAVVEEASALCPSQAISVANSE
jgi:ferredoxin